jgi:predicted ABC-type exoprotein transport system permease subunit
MGRVAVIGSVVSFVFLLAMLIAMGLFAGRAAAVEAIGIPAALIVLAATLLWFRSKRRRGGLSALLWISNAALAILFSLGALVAARSGGPNAATVLTVLVGLPLTLNAVAIKRLAQPTAQLTTRSTRPVGLSPGSGRLNVHVSAQVLWPRISLDT